MQNRVHLLQAIQNILTHEFSTRLGLCDLVIIAISGIALFILQTEILR